MINKFSLCVKAMSIVFISTMSYHLHYFINFRETKVIMMDIRYHFVENLIDLFRILFIMRKVNSRSGTALSITYMKVYCKYIYQLVSSLPKVCIYIKVLISTIIQWLYVISVVVVRFKDAHSWYSNGELSDHSPNSKLISSHQFAHSDIERSQCLLTTMCIV